MRSLEPAGVELRTWEAFEAGPFWWRTERLLAERSASGTSSSAPRVLVSQPLISAGACSIHRCKSRRLSR
jgi:hypothetical protein